MGNDSRAQNPRPFRFYDNRQKYLTFVTTCDEKWRVAERAARELSSLAPVPPALRLFDAGVGDGTVLAHLLRAMHDEFPTIPFYVVGKEISLDDARLTLHKPPDRFVEHPQTLLVLSHLPYAEAPTLQPATAEKRAQLVFKTVELEGDTSRSFGEQLRDQGDFMAAHWTVEPSPKTGNPLYVTPTVMIIHRRDQRFALDAVVPRRDSPQDEYDLILASQPWRSRMPAEFKVRRILAPLCLSLRSHGTLLGIQSAGGDPGMEIIHRIWPDEDPFPVDRHALLAGLRDQLGPAGRDFDLMALPNDESRLTYSMHTLPDEIDKSIGTSTLFAAWNAVVYVAEVGDDRVEQATIEGEYLGGTALVLHVHDGLWFEDETFVVRRH